MRLTDRTAELGVEDKGLRSAVDTKFVAVMSSAWPWESQLSPRSLSSFPGNREDKSSCFTDFTEESFNQVRP